MYAGPDEVPPVGPLASYRLVRLGSFATDGAVRGLDLSEDGRWAVAGAKGGSLYLFDYDAGPPFVPMWSSTGINVTNGPTEGSSHPVAISLDGSVVSAGTGKTSRCGDPSALGCLFVFARDGGGVPMWNRSFPQPVVATDVADAYVVAAGGKIAVFDRQGNLYWEFPFNAGRVDLTYDGAYLAVSGISFLYLFRNVGTGYTPVWTFSTGLFELPMDLAEDGMGLAAGEKYVFGGLGPNNVYQFWPGGNGWDAGDGTPCMTYTKGSIVWAVSVAGESSPLSGERVVAGRTWDDTGSHQFGPCNSTPASQWDTAQALSADSARAGCPPSLTCFSAFGGLDGKVYVTLEGDNTTVLTDQTGGSVHVITISPEYAPALVAGSEDGSVYFYALPVMQPDYAPWQPSPAGEIRVEPLENVSLSASVRNVGGADGRSPSTVAFIEDGSPSPFYTATIGALPAMTSSPPISATWTAPSNPGVYRVSFIADYGGAIVESDEGNNVHAFVMNVTRAPVTTLVVGTPRVDGTPTYVTSATSLSFSVADPNEVGIASTWYRIDGGPWIDYGATGPFTLAREGDRAIAYNSTDNLGVGERTRESVLRVDDSPPTTTLAVGDPKYVAGDVFVTPSTPLNLSASDGGLTPVGVETTEYRVDGGVWTAYGGPVTVTPEGSHTIEFRSRDRLGNVEGVQSASFLVDDTPPTLFLQVGLPSVVSSDTWVTAATPLSIESADAGSGVLLVEYRVWDGSWSPWSAYAGPFQLAGEGTHFVESQAADGLGHAVSINVTLLVDDSSPTTTLTVGDPNHVAGSVYVTSATPLALTATDQGAIPVGTGTTEYRVDGGPWISYASPFSLAGEGSHSVEFRSEDLLGNREAVHLVAVVVDDTPPTTSVIVGSPRHQAVNLFVTSATPIELVAADGGPDPSGVQGIEYRLDDGAWSRYAASLFLPGEGPHVLRYRAFDWLGNEATGSVALVVDDTPPSIVVDVGEPKYAGSDLFVTPSTPFSLSASDGGIDPVGLATLEYRSDGGSWIPYGAPFTVGGADGPKGVEYRAADLLGNAAADAVAVLLDDTPPVTTPSPGDDTYPPGTTFAFNATDAGCGVARVEVRVDDGAWTTNAGPLELAEGPHTIRFRSVDNLNNTEAERALSVTIEGAPPPAPEANWKPVVAAVFSAILAVVGVWSAWRVPAKARSRPHVRAALTALPFVVLEAATGVVSLLTGLLSIPPVLGLGTAVDVGILVAGVAIPVYRVRKWTPPK